MSSWIAAGDVVRQQRRADDPVLHLLFDVRVPARRRPRSGRRATCAPRGFLLGGTAGPHHAERRGPAARGRPQPRAGLDRSPTASPTTRPSPTRWRSSSRTACAAWYEEQEDVFYYITLMNENYAHPAPAGEGAREGILKGMYQLSDGGARQGPARAAARQRHHPARGDRGRRAAQERLGRDGRRLELPELQRAAARRASRSTRWNMLHPTEKPRVPYVTSMPGARDRGRSIASTDYMRAFADQIRELRAAPLQGARHRRLRAQRLAQEPAALLRGEPPLRRGRRAQGAGRRRRGAGREGRRGHRRSTGSTPRSRRPGPSETPRPARAMSNDQTRGETLAATEVKVPDIGDFKDIPVIELLVKPGDTREEGRLAARARERQGDDGGALACRGRGHGAEGQGRRQGERGRR